MTHVVAMWPPEPARGCCGGVRRPHVCLLRVRGSVCYLVLQSAAVACVGNPALSGENACSLRTAVWYTQCVTHIPSRESVPPSDNLVASLT